MMFCSTDSSGIRLNAWKIKPILRLLKIVRASSFMAKSAFPSTRISPEVGVSRAPIQFNKVLFPEPDSPTTAQKSPFSSANETFFNASTCTSPLP